MGDKPKMGEVDFFGKIFFCEGFMTFGIVCF